MKHKLAKVLKSRRKEPAEKRVADALETVPRITNETVAEHREEVLSSARKYIYPLQHSKHRVVKISTSLLALVVLAFFIYCGVSLYKLQSTSGFLYEVTRVIPFPVAKSGSSYVAYENYLFELRHYIHYYQTQQQVDFSSTSGKQQLNNFRKQALAQVTDAVLVKQLATKNHVSVSTGEVNDEVALVRAQNRLGSSDRVFQDVLQQFWGWNVADFKRELKSQLLAQKVVAKLDTATQARAAAALQQLQSGADFASLAKQTSDDAATKQSGGEYPGLIDQNNRDVAPQITAALFKLQPGQISSVINTGYSLEIVKVLDVNGSKVHAAHISFVFKPLETYLAPLRSSQKLHTYIKVSQAY